MLHHIVYVIELGRTGAGDTILYVGSTGLTAEERLAQHRRGYKANREVQRAREAKLRPDLAPRERYDAREVVRHERELYWALKREGYIVYGN